MAINTDIKSNVSQVVADIFAESANIPFWDIAGFGVNADQTNNKVVDIVTFVAGTAGVQSRNSIAWSTPGVASSVVQTATLNEALVEVVNLGTNPSETIIVNAGRAAADTIVNGLEWKVASILSATTQTSALSAIDSLSEFTTFIAAQKKAVGDLRGYSMILDSASYGILKANLQGQVGQPDYWMDGMPFGVRVFESKVLNDLNNKGYFFHRSAFGLGFGVEAMKDANGVMITPAIAPNGIPFLVAEYSVGADKFVAYGFYMGSVASTSLNTRAVKLS